MNQRIQALDLSLELMSREMNDFFSNMCRRALVKLIHSYLYLLSL